MTTVADAMHQGVVSCPADTPLQTVAGIMAEHRIHCVVVFDRAQELEVSGEPWGVISDLDLVASIDDLDSRTAASAAATPVVIVAPQEPLRRGAQLMAEYGTAHLVVVDPSSTQPLGVLSTLDVARTLANEP
jgi:CBS domain-containing protein